MLFFPTLLFFCPKFLVSGRRGSTSSEKKRSKSRSGRDKSPFRSFRWPKSKARPEQPGSYSDDEDGSNITQRSTLRKFGVDTVAGDAGVESFPKSVLDLFHPRSVNL